MRMLESMLDGMADSMPDGVLVERRRAMLREGGGRKQEGPETRKTEAEQACVPV